MWFFDLLLHHLNTNQPVVQCHNERQVKQQANYHGDQVVRGAFRKTGHGAVPAMFHGDAPGYCPGQETAEQQHVRKSAVGQQMGKRPDLDGSENRVFHRSLEPAR